MNSNRLFLDEWIRFNTAVTNDHSVSALMLVLISQSSAEHSSQLARMNVTTFHITDDNLAVVVVFCCRFFPLLRLFSLPKNQPMCRFILFSTQPLVLRFQTQLRAPHKTVVRDPVFITWIWNHIYSCGMNESFQMSDVSP
jgi:hypothetical protein